LYRAPHAGGAKDAENPFKSKAIKQTGRIAVAAAAWEIASASKKAPEHSQKLLRETATWIEMNAVAERAPDERRSA
jgi:hypothetical protein